MVSVKKNIIYNGLYQIFAIIVPLLTTPYLSRVLGAEGIGTYAYAYSIAYYVTLFIKLGLNNYGSRTIAFVRDDKKELSKSFWNIYASQFILGILLTTGYVIYVKIFFGDDFIAHVMVLFVMSGFCDITWFFSGMEEFKIISLRDIAIKTIMVIAIFVCVRSSEDVWKYTFILTFGMLLSQLSLWTLLFKRVCWVQPTYKEVLRHLKPNVILFLPTIAVSLYKIMDKIMLGSVAGQIEVGYYESCERVLNVPLAVINALGTAMLPHISYLYTRTEQHEHATHIFRISEHLMVMISSLISFGIMAVASDLVPIFYGKGFEKCEILFYILLPSSIFLAFANVIRTQYLIPLKKDKEYTVSLFLGAIVNLLINFYAIPKFQSVGAAIGTLIAEMTVCITQIILVCKSIPIARICTECIWYVVIAIVMFGIGFFIPTKDDHYMFSIIEKIIVCGCFWVVMMVGILRRKSFMGMIIKELKGSNNKLRKKEEKEGLTF